MSITFEADEVSVTAVGRGGTVRVIVEGKGSDIAEALELDDRLHDLDPHEIVNHIGASNLLETMDEDEITSWLSSNNADPTDFLSAIGEKAVLEWLNN